MSLIDTFQDYQDVWHDSDDIWHRGATSGALNGCVLVNPRMAETISLIVRPLMSGELTITELLIGAFTVKPHE